MVPEGLALFERLTGAQLLNFVGRMYGLDRAMAAERSAELLEFMDLKNSADKLVADYSHGMKKKTALAAAVIHGPEILFLDEPFEGVDAIAATTLKRLLQRFISHGGTVFLTSHVLEVVERLCTHIGIIQSGRLVASGSLEELRAGVTIAGHDHSPLTLEEIFLQIVGGAQPGCGGALLALADSNNHFVLLLLLRWRLFLNSLRRASRRAEVAFQVLFILFGVAFVFITSGAFFGLTVAFLKIGRADLLDFLSLGGVPGLAACSHPHGGILARPQFH